MVEGGKELIGQTISKRYRIIKMLGEGASAWVYLAEDTVNDTLVAIKVIRPSLAADGRFLKRFHNEATTLAKIRSSHAAKVFDYGTDDELEITYIVMEYIQGRTIARLVEEDGPLPVELALGIARQVALCLVRTQEEEIVHRDVKPANIMVTPDGMVKMTDFGIAKSLIKTGLTQTGVLGTPYYISPEQADGKPLDARSDIYSLGCTLFHMLTGHPPFEGDNPVTVVMRSMTAPRPLVSDEREDVSEAVDGVVMNCMATDREARFWPRELIAAINSVIGEAESTGLERPDVFRRELNELYERINALSADVEGLRSQIVSSVPERRGIPRWALAVIVLGTLLLAVTYGVGYYFLRGQGRIPADASQLDTRISAVETASAAIALTPVVQSSDLYQKGVVAVQAGRYSEAVALLEMAIELDPNHADAYYELGRAHFKLQQYGQAIARLQKAIQLKPEYADAYILTGWSHFWLQQYDEALLHFQRGVELSPNDPGAQCGLGITLSRLGRHKEGIARLERAIELEPYYVDGHYYLGLAYLQRQQYDHAVAGLQKAVELKPDHAEAYIALGWSYRGLERYDLARSQFEKACGLAPNNSSARYGLGLMYYLTGQYSQALAPLERAIEINPNHADAYYYLAWTYYRLGDCNRAVPVMKNALELKPTLDRAKEVIDACQTP